MDGQPWKPKTFPAFTTSFAIGTITTTTTIDIKRYTSYWTIDREVGTQTPITMFRPLELHVPINRLGSVDGHPFELGLGNILVQELGSFVEGSKNPTTYTSTPKSMDEVVEEVMQVDKEANFFQTMAIVSLNMGNLNLEVSSLKNILDTKEKKKAIL